MKKRFALIFVLMLTLVLCACGGEEAENEGNLAQMANPMVPSSFEEVRDTVGTVPLVPADAEDTSWYVINGVLGEVQFTLNGRAYCSRVQKTDTEQDISGMYFSEPICVDSNNPFNVTVEGNGSMACATWFDDGFSYAVCTDGDCDLAEFEAMVSGLFR